MTGVLAVVVATALLVAFALPWLTTVFSTGLSSTGVSSGTGAARVTFANQVRTWLPAALGALVSVGVAYAAALGIGALRPLGKGSEWLLLPFAPWLLAGSGTLAFSQWSLARDLDLIGTFAALIPPVLVSVPALVVLTLLCRGLAQRATTGFARGVLLPSLPMAGVLAGE